MARNLLEELFEKAKRTAQGAANTVKQTVRNIPQNLQKSSEKYIPGGIQGGINRVKQSKPSDYFILSPQSLKRGGASGQYLANTTKRWGQSVPEAPGRWDDTKRTAANFMTNFFNVGASAANKAGAGSQNIVTGFQQRKPLQVAKGAGQFLYGSGTAYLNAIPAYHALNLASSVDKPIDQKRDFVRRFSTGILEGMSDTDNLSQHVPRRMQQFFGMEFDPAEAGGKMLGFVKHPVNQKLFQLTEGIKLPMFAKDMAGNPGLQRTIAKASNFLSTNAIRGSIEDIVMSLEELPEDATPQQQLQHLIERGLWGAVSENVGRGFFKGTEAGIGTAGKVLSGQLEDINFKPVVEFLEDVNILRRASRSASAPRTPSTAGRAPRSAADIIRDARGRFATAAEEIRKPVVDWIQNPDNPAQLLRTEDGVIPKAPPARRPNLNFTQDPNQPSRYVRTELARSRLKEPSQAAAGFIGGVETDEEGNVTYNPEKGMAGFFAAGAIQSKAGRKLLQEGVEKLTKQADEIIENPQSADEFISNARATIKQLPEEPKVTWREAWDRFYTDWVNRFHPIEKAVGAVETNLKKQGAELRPEFNPKYQIRRFLGLGGIAENKFQERVRPILNQMEEQGIEKLDMDAYLKARRDINLGERGIFGSDPVKAQATVEAFEAKYGADKLQGVAQQFYDYQNNLFDELVESGFVKPDVAARIKATNADYVPFQRVMDDAQLDEFLGIPTKKVTQGSNPVQKIEGSERDIYSPIESIIANTYKYTAAVEKNKVARSVARLMNIMPEIGFKVSKESSSSTIPVWVDGVKHHVDVGKDIADAAKGLNEEQMNNVLKIMQLPALILRSGATGQNPEFMIPNVFRDQFEATLYSNYGYRPFIDYFKGVAHLVNKGRTGSDEIVDAWMKSGASQELSSMSGRKDIQSFFNQKTGRKGLFGWLGDALDFMGRYSEQPTRLGLFERAYKATNNTNIAMMESRDATLDFSRMGAKMKVANSIIPFLNVGVQGFDKLIRQAKDKPGQTALKVAVYGMLPQMTSTMYNLVFHPDEYAEIPQFEKDNNFVFVQGRNEDGTVNYYTVPKATSMTNFVNPMENFLSYLAGTNKQSFGEFATAFLSGALPVVGEGSSLQEVGVRTVGQLTPQITKPLAENLLNKSFFRYNADKQEAKEIVPYFMKDKAPGDQAYDFTPDAYKVIGKVFNVSPLQVQNLAEGYFAGYAKVPVQLINLMAKASRGEEVTPNEVTLARRFLKQTYPTSESQQKKRQAKETPLISQAGAVSEIPESPEVFNSGAKTPEIPTDGEDNRNWFQKLFNIQPSESDSEPEELRIPSDDKGLEVMYKEAQSILDDYETKKTKYQYGRYEDPEGKLEELEADKAYAEQIMRRIEEEHPEKIADFEMKSYKSEAGHNVDERAEWAYQTIRKLAETGDTEKVTELIDKLWDEKVLTGGDSGVAQKILEEYGIDVFNYGSDPKKSKGGKGSGKSSASSKIKKEAEKQQEELMDVFFKAAKNAPKINTDINLPKSQVNWGATFKASSPASAEDTQFNVEVPKAPTVSMQQFFGGAKPKPTGVSEAAYQTLSAVRGRGAADDRLRLRYAGGRSR